MLRRASRAARKRYGSPGVWTSIPLFRYESTRIRRVAEKSAAGARRKELIAVRRSRGKLKSGAVPPLSQQMVSVACATPHGGAPVGRRRTCLAVYPSPRAEERRHRSHMRDEPRFARRLERRATSDVAPHHAPQGLRGRPIAMNTYAEWSAAGGGQLSCPPSLPRVARAAQRGAPARTSGSMHAQATVVARSRHLPDLSA